MLHIAICDDDAHMRSYLFELCIRILPEAVIHQYDDGKKLINERTDFDILLMDIRLGELDGLQAVKLLQDQSVSAAGTGAAQLPAVIFITAYGEHVFEALDLYPFHYLLKPLDEAKFESVLRTAAQACSSRKNETALFFHTKSSHRRIYPSEICYVESCLRKVIIHTEAEPFEVYATMNELEKRLGSDFFRCHRGYLVNMDKISGYDKQTIRLRNGAALLMSKPKYSAFVEAYMRFLNRGEDSGN